MLLTHRLGAVTAVPRPSHPIVVLINVASLYTYTYSSKKNKKTKERFFSESDKGNDVISLICFLPRSRIAYLGGGRNATGGCICGLM